MKWSLTKLQWIGAMTMTIFILIALIGPFLLPYSPTSIAFERLLTPSAENWLGTNTIGQDLFTQLIYGTRNALFVGLMVSLISTMLSVVLGLAAGYSHKLDPILNGLANMLMVLPSLLLILVIASFIGGSTWQMIWTLGLLTWPAYMKMIRATVLSVREREFVKSAQLYKASSVYIMRRHLFPFITPLVRTKFIMTFRYAIALEASLAFLGIGNPSVISWGKMLQDAFARTQTFLTDAWIWEVIPPSLMIMIITIALALLGEKGTDKYSLSNTRASYKRKGIFLDISHQTENTVTKDDHERETYALEVDSLAVSIDGNQILKPISLKVKRGQLVSIIGSSGSGKTTFAKALYGLDADLQVTGQVYVQSTPVYSQTSVEKLNYWHDIAFVFQDARAIFNPIMKIGKQMEEVLDSTLSKKEKKQLVIEALLDVQLTEQVYECYAHQLSGGMLSRALIALALINKPDVLLADEPTGALDPIIKREVFNLLITKVKENNMTLILITHDINAAIAISDVVYSIEQGQLLSEEQSEQFLQRWRKE